jgi:hypothetical protein
VTHEPIAVIEDLDHLTGRRLLFRAFKTVDLAGVDVGTAGQIVGLEPDGP